MEQHLTLPTEIDANLAGPVRGLCGTQLMFPGMRLAAELRPGAKVRNVEGTVGGGASDVGTLGWLSLGHHARSRTVREDGRERLRLWG